MRNLILFFAILLSSLFTSVFAQTKAEKHFYKGEYNEALQSINEKIEAGKATVPDYQLAAQCSQQLFDYQSAINAYNDALKLAPANIQLLEGYADANLNLGFKKEALAAYRQILEIDSTLSRIEGKLASVYMDLNQYAKAEPIYQKLYVADSSNVYFMRRYMQAMYKLDKLPALVDLCWQNPYFPNNNSEMSMILADSYFQMNNNAQALGILYNIFEQDSLYMPAISKVAYIHFASYRNYEDAVDYYRILTRLEENKDPFHLKNRAICEYFVGNHEYAAPVLDSLSILLNNDPFVMFYAGLAYKKLGNSEKTLGLLKMAAEFVIPGYTADIYHHLGRAYAANRMFEKAIETYKKVREYDNTNYQVLYDTAICYEEWTRNRTVALGYYQQFVRECTNMKSADLAYAENRIKLIKEELFFEGQ